MEVAENGGGEGRDSGDGGDCVLRLMRLTGGRMEGSSGEDGGLRIGGDGEVEAVVGDDETGRCWRNGAGGYSLRWA